MLSPDDLTFYIVLAVCMIVLFQIRSKAMLGDSPVASVIRRLTIVLMGAIILLGVFYARVRKSGLPSFDAGVIALDVVFAHLVLTLPVFLELFYVARGVAPWMLALLVLVLSPLIVTLWGVARVGAFIMRRDNQDARAAINGLLLPLVLALLPFYKKGREVTQVFLYEC